MSKRLFSCKITEIAKFSAALDTLKFNKVLRQEFVYLFVNENGLRFVCEICKDFQVNVYIDKTNLQEFELDEPFECLLKMDQLFASMIMKNATCMELIFEETENQIKLFRVNMEAPNVRTTLKLHTFNGGQVLDFQFDGPTYPQEDGKIALQGITTLLEILTEINTKESPVFNFIFSSREGICSFVIIMNEPFLKTTITFTKASTEVRQLTAREGTHRFAFRSCYIKSLIKAVRQSSNVIIRVNSNGFLCVQCDMKKIFGYGGMVEFFAVPIVPERSEF